MTPVLVNHALKSIMGTSVRVQLLGFPGDSDGKASAHSAGDLGSIPGSGRSPGEGRATCSSILAWRIPWTEEPGRLQSMGTQRVGPNGAISLSFFEIHRKLWMDTC